nr:hypothetical protein Hi04_10k_c2476_00028 [uncultured bacterium]
MQDFSLRRISKRRILKPDRAFGRINLDRVRRIDDIIFSIQNFEAPFCAGRRAFHRPRGVSQRFDWSIEHQEISAENEQRAEGQRSSQDMERADIVHCSSADHGQRANDERAVHIGEG